MEFDASLKGVVGKIQLTAKTINWHPNEGSAVVIDLVGVAGMKATPPTAAKARIQLQTADTKYVFDFKSRPELDSARDNLQKAIKTARDSSEAASATPETTGTAGTTPNPEPAPPTAPTAPPKPRAVKRKKIDLNPKVLLANLELQRDILKKNRELMLVFQEVVVKGSLTNEQFWEMRMELLQTAALENGQARGSYNVLSTIKPTTTSDNKINLSLTREKIHDLFDQYPIVRKAYNENVPPLSEGAFWQRFFQSRLFLQLRGERVSNNHPYDSLIDKYLDILEEQRIKRQQAASIKIDHQVPLFFDVAANSENNPETIGNAPDLTMKPQYSDMEASRLIKSMNVLSKRLLLNKRGPTSTTDPDIPDLTTELRLADLQDDNKQGASVDLHITVSNQVDREIMISEQEFEAQKQALLANLVAQPIDLREVGDSTDELIAAQQQIQDLVAQQSLRNEKCDTIELSEEAYLCHAATLEFLRHFWRAHARKDLVEPYVESLRKSLDRIDAVVNNSGPHIQNETKVALAPLVKSVHRALAVSGTGP